MSKNNKKQVENQETRTVSRYEVQYFPIDTGGGWMLERYEFHKLANGTYQAFIQGGDRYTGGSRTFDIPKDYLDGTYEEFLDKYEQLVPGGHFGLSKEDLLVDGGLKAFLGLMELNSHPEVQIGILPKMSLLGKYEHIWGDREHAVKENLGEGGIDLAKKLHEEVNHKFSELVNVHGGDLDDIGVWGIMSRGFYFDIPGKTIYEYFNTWGDVYRTGFYFAGFDAQMIDEIPDGWVKWPVPEKNCIIVDVRPGDYNEVYFDYINRIIPEMGYMLDGAICEFYAPSSDAITLYFPFKKMDSLS